MKKRSLAIAALLSVALLFAACGKSQPTPPAGEAPAAPAAASAEPAPAATGIQKIGDMADAWSALYNRNEKAINDYEGMPIMGLVTPPLAFAAAVQFDLMNTGNQNGRFEGTMMLAGYKGFVEKAGNQITFGYDDVLKKDGFGPAYKAGTRVVGRGSLLLDKEYFTWETANELEGKKVQRDRTEFKRLGDGSMICLALSGRAINMRGDAEMSDDAIYLHNGAGRYDFVIAKGKTGPEFQALSFADLGDLSKAQALELLKASGYEIEYSGSILGGKLALDPK